MVWAVCGGDDTIALFGMMERLREEALSHGGVVLSLLGNHEWMNAIGESRSHPSHFTHPLSAGDWR
jgi:hypothetical protein